MDIKTTPPSLRKRYLSLTIFMGVLVISLIAFSYFKMQSIKQSVNNGYQGVLAEQSQLAKTRNILLTINTDINLFLLDPLNEDLLTKIDDNTDQSVAGLRMLVSSKHEYHLDIRDPVLNLIQKFKQLNNEVKRLIEYRMDINKQYPAMDISANEMEHLQDQINSGIEILKMEIESGLNLNNPTVYTELLKLHTLWIKNISQSRIYMANRLATFSTEILEEQSQSLKDLNQLFDQNLRNLQKLYQSEESFEAEDILKNIQLMRKNWFDKFLLMREISEKGEWRTDTLLVKTRVLPVVNRISAEIDQIDAMLHSEKQNIDKKLQQNEEYFTYLIYGISFLFLIVISAMLISLEWMVFTPIRKVSKALKSKVYDISPSQIEAAKTKEIALLIEAYNEMDEEVSKRQKALEHQAMHDHLTGLPNRFLLNQRLEYQLLSDEREHNHFSLFLMDLNDFKEINDTLGHASGDNLLIEVAKRIQSLIRKSDTLARLGGDEFAVILPKTNDQSAKKIAEKIIDEISQPFEIQNEKINIGISIGITTYPEDGNNPEYLLQFADMAMYTAKRKRIGLAFYDQQENIYSKDRLLLVNDLTKALDQDELEIYFQPKVDLTTGTIFGSEALLRWNHPEIGFISPEIIIEAAEKIGIIQKLSLHILEKAVIQCRKWHDLGFPISVSVNLSVKDLANSELTSKIQNILDEQQLNYECLTLEITESIMMENLTLSLNQLNKLSSLGVRISIDDFGTGFSSLAYIKRLPVNELKIDKSFVMNIDKDNDDLEIVRSTIQLGHNLGLQVVTEGVENQNSLKIIRELEGDFAQGYYLSRPVNPKAFIGFLKQNENTVFK